MTFENKAGLGNWVKQINAGKAISQHVKMSDVFLNIC